MTSALLCVLFAASHRVLIGNFHVSSPNAITWLVDGKVGFEISPDTDAPADLAAPDNSYHRTTTDGVWEWGRVGDAVVGRYTMNSDQGGFKLTFHNNWPHPIPDSVTAGTSSGGWKCTSGGVTWELVMSNDVSSDTDASHRTHFVAGIGKLPATSEVDSILDKAKAHYEATRISATGDRGDFLGPIAATLNDTRVYSDDIKRLAHTVSRKWAKDGNVPFFCWDSFFNGALACLEDPETARETVRTILSFQTPQGLVPNFAHWGFADQTMSEDRSQPPVGSMCVWKMHQRQPDLAFLREVYPKLAKWHRWWPVARDGNHNGLLEWGSALGELQGAKWETGWDDTVAFEGASMFGPHMNADAVDLSSLWAADAHYLGLIARALGKTEEAVEWEREHREISRAIEGYFWAELPIGPAGAKEGLFCNRLWNRQPIYRLTPMCFYPLICGVEDADKVASTIALMQSPKFWGDWVLPTVAFDDKDWPKQDYWRGKVWAPVNFLVFQGVQRYAPIAFQNEFAAKSVRLFMRNWTAKHVCGENYLSSTGEQSSDPHYTWGALLCLIGLENICRIEDDGRVSLNGTLKETLTLRNVPIHGKPYEIRVTPGRAELWHDGKSVLTADGKVVTGAP